MAANDDILRALYAAYRIPDEVFSIRATVASLDLVNLTCDCEPLNEGADILNVKLIADKTSGFVVIPTIGSIVYVSFLSPDDGYISMFSHIDMIKLNGNNYGGLVKVDDLVTKLNNLENLVNDLIVKYNAHTHPYVNGTSPATTSVTTSLETGNIAPITNSSMISSTYSYHGSGL